jgi:hypothetical protein
MPSVAHYTAMRIGPSSTTHNPLQHSFHNTKASVRVFSAIILRHPTLLSAVRGAAFGSALQQQQQEAASRLQQIPFGQPVTPAHQMPGAPTLGQGGQQPILNVSAESGG